MAAQYPEQRATMVRGQLRGRGITDERVLAAMGEVPRELFVPERLRRKAYRDRPLPIGHHQTISQPFVVAHMLQVLELGPDDTVLEVGAGSGYTAALLARLTKRVVSVERIPELTERARRPLDELGIGNVELICGDGSHGWPDAAPYDAIAVHAMAPKDPSPFIGQLVPGGRLVVPMGDHHGGELMCFTVDERGHVTGRSLGVVSFVPLISG